jgi:hypothetical protein
VSEQTNSPKLNTKIATAGLAASENVFAVGNPAKGKCIRLLRSSEALTWD